MDKKITQGLRKARAALLELKPWFKGSLQLHNGKSPLVPGARGKVGGFLAHSLTVGPALPISPEKRGWLHVWTGDLQGKPRCCRKQGWEYKSIALSAEQAMNRRRAEVLFSMRLRCKCRNAWAGSGQGCSAAASPTPGGGQGTPLKSPPVKKGLHALGWAGVVLLVMDTESQAELHPGLWPMRKSANVTYDSALHFMMFVGTKCQPALQLDQVRIRSKPSRIVSHLVLQNQSSVKSHRDMSVKQQQGEDLGLFLPTIHFYLETPKCHERACRKTSLTPPALWFSPGSTSSTPSLCSRNMPGILGRKTIFLSQAGLKNDAYKCVRTRYPNDMWQKDSNLAVLERNALFCIQQKEGQLEGWAPI